ncbi:DUF2812 domain-containing protein [Streptococcus suis]|uniref:DUF2812 domain-containing protein n=1 Tax=Streptococcus suis TaxID=1307 RepID=UPI001478C600
METKTEWKVFFITDFEQEAAYLSNMHHKGWALVEIQMGMWYVFESCPPENVVYQVDFRPEKKEEQAVYEQMYHDYGWEHVTDCNHFGIFRKKGGGDTELYSDLKTKKAMVSRIFKQRYLFILAVYGLTLPIFLRHSPILALAISLLYLPLLTILGLRFYRMMKTGN